MAGRSKRPSEGGRAGRAELIARLLDAGRAQSTAAVMFHAAVAAQLGLSVTEEKALDLLHRHGALTAGELAERSGLAPASVTGLMDRLASKGFARRIADPDDRRRVRLELDPSLQTRMRPLFTHFVEEMRALC